ncbi:ATP-dependent zinc metalloprotease FtsH [Bacillus sp. M6-12]|uniref:ATP-dependent metallopeptidase FtsH/Yme1/Tma family protein n=1 Tax=Bacillus sp. M6-12 TaxID=2054166 RepID=UPI000C758CA2|nr:FtsH/Yme1/Tma family ATP-dependent metallopeptidase [Bacillus sp. M6-12]PLS19182.1 ATP-dependent zinc metalloprotease FtsH [Bacillus sp. M6-12]
MKDFWEKVKGWYEKRKKVLPFILILLLVSGVTYYVQKPEKPKDISYKEFTQMVEKDKVKEVTINLKSPTFTFEGKDKETYKTDNPKDEEFKKYLLENEVKVEEVSTDKPNVLLDMFLFVFRIIILVIVFKIIMDMMSNSKGVGHEETKETVPKVKFNEIAGNEEAKEEMQFLVEFLKNPKKYSDMGAKLPKGVVFYGPPGTGKTLTAKAIAGEAGVPFFSISGSDFVEMYVGLGAKRVRDLFKKARKKAPCIIFIDEIDAVGTKRGNDSNSEKDQTINALLNELDGFNGSEGVIVITATNRIEDLDNALIRPGRFDKHIAINLPDQRDRAEILKVHARSKKIAEDVDFNELAKLTIGFAGAGLEALINEATILAVTRNHTEVTKEDVDDAYFKMVMKGHKKKNQEDRKDDELELVAWHEAGHALVAKLLAHNEVPKVTIISSTSGAGGVTFITPKKMGLYSKQEIKNNIKTLYAGRIAEYLLLGDEEKITTGASNDIERATEQIKGMIDYYGMSETFGMIQVSALGGQKEILKEASSISKTLYEETLEFMKKHHSLLGKIAVALLEKETLSEEELDTIIAQYQEDSMS